MPLRGSFSKPNVRWYRLDGLSGSGKGAGVARRVEIRRALTFGAFWEPVLLPWLNRFSGIALAEVRPVVVVVPSRGVGSEIKGRWLREGAGGVGVRFWTPGDLRRYLLGRLCPGQAVASREILHLLLSQSAVACGGGGVASSVSADPSVLMRALDDLAAAGWGWEHVAGGEDVLAVVQDFRDRLGAAGLWTAQRCDWELAARAGQRERGSIRALLVHGFSGAQWPLWALLLAGVRCAEEAMVTVACPRRQAERVDQLWVSSWEEHLGVAAEELGADPEPGPFALLAERLEAGELVAVETAGVAPDFEVGENAASEARAIVGRVMSWLPGARGSVGVVLPDSGILSREVARLLCLLGVPHHDGLGSPAVPGADEAAWREWLALQLEWSAGSLARFVAKRPPGLWPAADGVAVLPDRLDRAMGATLDDDLDVLRAALRVSRDAKDRAALGLLDGLARLPAEGEFAAMASSAERALGDLRWGARAAALAARARPLAGTIRGPVRRGHFLAWAEAALEATGRERGTFGREPFARVQLVSAREAEPQAWDAVILAGMNEGEWPRVVQPNAFLPEAARAALNLRAVAPGGQGEGHETLAAGRGFLLGEAEWRYLGLRQCFNLIEGARSRLCLSARRRGEENPGRLLGAADLLVKAHYVATGVMLTDDQMATLSSRSAALWAGVESLPADGGAGAEPGWPGAGPAEAREAWDARRDRRTGFGPYDFCLRHPPRAPIRLACKAWEEAWSHPAATWLSEVVGVEPITPLGEGALEARSMGTWAHAWLARALNPEGRGILVAAPQASVALAGVCAAAGEERDRAGAIFREAGRELPVLWEAVWRRALWAAKAMCEEALDPAGGYVGTEWHLPDDCHLDLGDGATLWLRGRVDLLRSDAPTFGGPVSVIDFKTGAELKLTPAEIRAGKGLQVVLYGEALRDSGASEVTLRVIRPEGGGTSRRVERAPIMGLLRALARMQDTGIFGVRGAMYDEFGYCPAYPMATLPTPADINDERWALTHRAAGEDEP